MSPRHSGKFVAYYRVSTARQGDSGLGLDAQRHAVQTFLDGGKWTLVGEFTEVESGKVSDRPELAKALDEAKGTGARLIVAKLDRLSRDVEFLARMLKSSVKFVACDLPDANELTIHIMAAVAQQERERISQRTKDALQEAKKRGVQLGNPHGTETLRPHQQRGSLLGAQALKDQAQAFAQDVAPIIANIATKGITSLHGIAAELNKREILTPRGHVGTWTPATVARVKRRLEAKLEPNRTLPTKIVGWRTWRTEDARIAPKVT